MPQNASINIRVDENTKQMAETLFALFGITLSDAIKIFLNKSVMSGGFPFDVTVPPQRAALAADFLNYKRGLGENVPVTLPQLEDMARD
jgi:DNA-damage-inducible protein J